MMDKSEERYLKSLDESLKKISKSLEKLVKLEEIKTSLNMLIWKNVQN